MSGGTNGHVLGNGHGKDKGLRIVVCAKVVPKPEEVKVDEATKTLIRANVRSEINPCDLNAIEAALELRDQHGGVVTIVSMGPPMAEPYLQLLLAMGADHAYLLSDRAFGGADTLATSYTLAAGIRKIGKVDLVLCGEESSDGATAQVPAGIAEWLGATQATYVTEMRYLPEKCRLEVERELPGGHERLRLPLPTVISMKTQANEPRFLDTPRLRAIRAAGTGVTVWTAADLDVDPEALGLKGSATAVAGVGKADGSERKRERLAGTPEQEAEALFERIRGLVK
jgi:electron transfer flavoprotein beta subunit